MIMYYLKSSINHYLKSGYFLNSGVSNPETKNKNKEMCSCKSLGKSSNKKVAGKHLKVQTQGSCHRKTVWNDQQQQKKKSDATSTKCRTFCVGKQITLAIVKNARAQRKGEVLRFFYLAFLARV